MNFVQLLARSLAVPCDPSRPKKPAHLGVMAVSDTQVLMVWDKPLGNGYRYKVEVKVGALVIQVLYGETGFGNAKTVIVYNLQPGQAYDFSAFHECTHHPGTYSTPRMLSATTMGLGKFFFLLKSLYSFVGPVF